MFDQILVNSYGFFYKTYLRLKHSFSNLGKSPMAYVVMLQIASILVVYGKGASQVYLDMFLLLLVITLTSYYLAKKSGYNTKIILYTMVLLTIGTMLQCIFVTEQAQFDPDVFGMNHSILGLQVQYILGFIGGIAVAWIYKRARFLIDKKIMYCMCMIMTILYVITLVGGKSIGNVRNWLVVGGFSFQASEVNKLIYIFLLAGLLCTVENPSAKRIKLSFLLTICNVMFLTLQSEFGTMLLLLAVFFSFLFLFVPNIKVAIYTSCGFVLGSALLFGIGNAILNYGAINTSFGANAIVQAFLFNFQKIQNRIIFWLDPSKDPLGLGYQLIKAKEAIMMGGLFGTDRISALPVKTSDLVFPALIERCGIIIAILVFVIFVLVWLNGIKIYIASKDKYHQGICAGIVFLFFYQSILIIAGSSGICPLTGITLPFISSGGTSLVISFIMIGIVTSISGDILWKGVKESEEVVDKAVIVKEVIDKEVMDNVVIVKEVMDKEVIIKDVMDKEVIDKEEWNDISEEVIHTTEWRDTSEEARTETSNQFTKKNPNITKSIFDLCHMYGNRPYTYISSIARRLKRGRSKKDGDGFEE